MARGKKVAQGLTPEKKLAQALVPMEEQPYHIPENWCWTYLTSGVAECLDNFRSPINATERASRSGDVPYYGDEPVKFSYRKKKQIKAALDVLEINTVIIPDRILNKRQYARFPVVPIYSRVQGIDNQGT